jgi:hypothetical protein
MRTKILTYTSSELMMPVNACIAEAEKELVIVDITLAMSDSKSLKQKSYGLAKPLQVLFLHQICVVLSIYNCCSTFTK